MTKTPFIIGKKKSSYADSYFKDKQFSAEDYESIEHIVRDLDTCSKKYFLLPYQNTCSSFKHLL